MATKNLHGEVAFDVAFLSTKEGGMAFQVGREIQLALWRSLIDVPGLLPSA
jgi:hypothetical protein